MENTSIIFERESRLLVETKNDQTARSTIVGLLSHEMAHQYFGDLVTCAWWDETWLNEGFATWLGANTADDANDNDEVEVRRTRSLIEHYFHQDDGARAHALRVKNGTPGEIFDSISYSKGAQVLRMLELWVGKAELKKALKAYLEKYALGPVTSDDFFKVVFETTKKEKELKPFKDAWLNQPGYPVIFPDTSFGGGKLTVTIRQQPSRPGEKTPFVFKLPIVVHREAEPAYTQEQLITVDKAEVKVTFDVPAAPEWINWNKDFGALVKVNATSVSEDQAIDASRHDTDPTWRLVATWQLIAGLPTLGHKDEAHLSEAAMGALLDVITKDPSPYVREAVLERLLDNGLEKLPKELAAPVLAVAKRPEGLNDDAAGTIRVKNAAVELLGRLPGSEGHAWLLEQLDRRDLDINYLSGFAAGAARLGTSNALASLSTAIVTQKSRGYAYYHRAAEPLGSVASTEVVPSLKELFAANRANPELLRGVLDRLEDNTALKATPELAAFVRWVVLDEGFGDELRSAVLSVIADVKTDAAKDVLTRVVNETKSERLRLAAKKLLDANFPTALAPPAAPAPKAKK
jgi:aminopeptidase N